MSKKKISVCVVGAGPAGLCTARHLAADSENFTFDVFEQTSELGGVWVYTERTGVDDEGHPVHSSMYKGLRTNFPLDFMFFPDLPLPQAPSGQSSYLTHREVLKYLREYAAHFDLHKYIQYRTRVRQIEPVEGRGAGGGGERWRVTLWDLEQKKETTKEYDAVAVCNGVNNVPDIPSIRDIELFKGETMHAHDYRTPDRFKGKRLAIIGASYSGKDIAMEAAHLADAIYLCHALAPLSSKFPKNVVERATIARATESGFTLIDGSTVEADVLVYATGYKYVFPFLSPRCGIKVQGKRVTPLYKHMLNIERPTLALMGVPFGYIPFFLFEVQAPYFLHVLKSPWKLPSKAEMLADEENEMRVRKERGFPARHAHRLFDMQWALYDFFSTASGGWRVPPHIKDVYMRNFERQRDAFGEFRDDCYTDFVKELLAKEKAS